MSVFGTLWRLGKIGTAFIPGVGPMISGGMHLAETASKGKKGKWGLDELLAAVPFGAQAGVPGLNKIPGLGGGGDPTNGGLGSMAGEVDSMGNSLGGGAWNWIKQNPMAVLMGAQILGSIPGGAAERKLTGAQRLLMEEQLKKMQRDSVLQQQAQQALGKMFQAGPYSRSAPDMSGIFGGGRR